VRFRLTTFGGLRLEADGEVVTGPPAQRRRLALLALLAATDQQKVPREKAFGLLWPEQPTSRARHQLSESLYVLRRLMGEDAILSANDDLALNTDVIWTDVTEFQARVVAGNEDVTTLYRGPFLDGFHLKEAPEFDLWAETIRERLARQVGRSLETFAQTAAAGGNLLDAAEWWGRLAEHDPLSSRIACRYMSALANAGERARALQFASTHATRLREELGVDPDADFQAILSQLQQPIAPSSGVALAGSSPADKSVSAEPPTTAPVLPNARPASERRDREDVAARARWSRIPRRVAAVAAVSLLAAAAAFASRFERSETLPIVGDIKAMTFEPGVEIEPSLSPDGRYVAYAGGTPSRLYLRQQGSRPVLLVTPDTGPPQHRPRWSPDGTRIAFDAGRRIYVIPALGGTPQRVVADGWSPTWAPDGQRIAYALDDTIFITDVRGGRPTPLAVVIEPAELTWSPDGRWIALTAGNDVWDGLIHIGNIAPSRILLIGTGDGRVVEVTDRSAMHVAPTWTPDSRQLIFISNRAGARDIYRVRLNDDGRPIGGSTRLTTGIDAHTMSLSASGRRMVYATYRGHVNIWSVPISSGAPASVRDALALTSGNQLIESISVSPDRKWIYFTSDRAGNSDIWRVPRIGGEPTQVTSDLADEFAPEQSPDGQWLAYYSLHSGTRDIWVRPTGPGEAVRLTTAAEEEHQPHWSPDGTRLCYSQESGRTSQYSIRMIRREGSGWSASQILPDANGTPNRLLGCAGWLPNGRHLVVQDPERSMIALMPNEGGGLRVLYRGDPARGRAQPIWVRVEPRTGTIFFRDWESIWLLNPANPVPRQIVRFDDGIRRSTRIEMDADGDRVYFTLGDPQGELFLTDISGVASSRN
jgi:Tol biopolymer transport system component/DNA-binding SARP family transcriptional activator